LQVTEFFVSKKEPEIGNIEELGGKYVIEIMFGKIRIGGNNFGEIT